MFVSKDLNETAEVVGDVICDVCQVTILSNCGLEDSESQEDEDGFHYCKEHEAAVASFTPEQKQYAQETKSTNLAGFAAWKTLQI